MTQVTDETIQGSEAWKKWRGKGIGASEMSAVMNESEYDTPLSLWKVKTGRVPPKENNFAMQAGNDQEAKIRALYELETGNDCPPALFEHPDYNWARCSLDGWIEDRKTVVEFKCFGAEKHTMVKEGRVPPSYIAQLQFQMFVTGARVVHFVSLDMASMSDLVIMTVTPDMAYWAKMIPAAQQFWIYLQTDTPPPITPDDFLEEVDPTTHGALEAWRYAKLSLMQLEIGSQKHTDEVLEAIKVQAKEIKERLELARADIQAAMKHPKIRAAGVKVISKKTGSIDVRLDEKAS